MKRFASLVARMAEPENLRRAFLKAARGKGGKADCREFQARLDENLATLRAELLTGQVRVGDYHQFRIFDPKERTICAASFGQRVLHHAVMAVCEPVLERAAVFDSYACRKGKGRLAAVARAQGYARRHAWFLKMDVRKCTALGMDFLGYRLFPDTMRLARRSKVRFARKFRAYERAFLEGEWGEAELQRRMQALVAFVVPADSAAFRRHVLARFGVAAIGLEPRDSRRQLEQQREQLPVGEPQQQQPVGQEQQPWVPGCAGPSSTSAPEGALADPAAIPSCAA